MQVLKELSRQLPACYHPLAPQYQKRIHEERRGEVPDRLGATGRYSEDIPTRALNIRTCQRWCDAACPLSGFGDQQQHKRLLGRDIADFGATTGAWNIHSSAVESPSVLEARVSLLTP